MTFAMNAPGVSNTATLNALLKSVGLRYSDVDTINMPFPDHVAALGESIEKFPQARVGELLDTVSEEISDERQKIRFRARLAKEL